MESSKVEPQSFEKGMLVTVVNGQTYTKEAGGLLSTTTEIIEKEDNSYKGDVLEVKAVDLPYIVLEQLDGPLSNDISLDIREWGFKQVTKEYAEAKCVDTEAKKVWFDE